jgi:hypothetical protein
MPLRIDQVLGHARHRPACSTAALRSLQNRRPLAQPSAFRGDAMMHALPDPRVDHAKHVPIEDELARRGVKLRGKIERSGPCPKCGGDDRFSINTKKQIFHCRGCDTGGDVIALVRHLDGVDFPTALTTLTGEPASKANGKSRARNTADEREVGAARYDYHDESGKLLFQVGRIEYKTPDGSYVLKNGKRTKSFRQRQPDPTHPGGWRRDVNGVRIVPYKLPELNEAISLEHEIVIVEGEAKVDLLKSWNVPATCNAQGSGQWKTEHSEFLRGANVLILPDNDQKGRDHADVVGASLQGIASSVRVLDLPGLPPKGDIIDFAKAGGTVEQLHDLIAQKAHPWKPAPSADDEGRDPHPELVDRPSPQQRSDYPQQTAAAADFQSPEWPDLGKGGKPTATCANARAAITALGIECRYDVFHDRKLVGGHAIEQWAGELSDHACHMVRVLIKATYGFDPRKENTHDAAIQLCLQRQFDPVRDFLDSLTWDSKKRLSNWLSKYLGAEENSLNDAIGRLALVAAVRRVRQPGCKFDQIIVLEGPEGTGKSTGIEILAGQENFSDQTIIGPDDRQQQEAVRGVWLFEIADLAGMSKADVDRTKAFASRLSDRAGPVFPLELLPSLIKTFEQDQLPLSTRWVVGIDSGLIIRLPRC